MPVVKTQREGSVVVLTMNNGENRFNSEMVGAIHGALDEIEGDESARAVVITGTGKYFSNGLDLDTLAQLPPEKLKPFLGEFHRMLKRLAIYPKPTVGAINGHAFAGGAMLAALMDYRYMRQDRGWFCLPEVDLGLPFWPGMIALLRWAIPDPHWKEMAFGGKRYTASQLLEMGVIDGALPLEELLPKCVEQAALLGAKNPAAYAEIKRRMKLDMIRVMDELDPPYFT